MDGIHSNQSTKRKQQEDSLSHDSNLQNEAAAIAIMSPLTKKARNAAGCASSMPTTSRSPLMYSFDPLPNGHIRLLKLMPHRDKNAPIQCHILSHFLCDPDSGDGPHLYEALSYVWGSPAKPRFVSTEEGSLAITRNLHAALVRLRDCSFPRIIWADGICINQEDLQERGHQVQMMALIYAKAVRVIVWLEETLEGDTTTNSDKALEAIRIAAQNDMGLKDSMTSPEREEVRRAVSTLFQRSWFHRVWVLQEISAARQVLIVTLRKEIDGYCFCRTLKALDLAFPGSDIENRVYSVADLLEGSISRPRNVTTDANGFSFPINPIGQLIDKYHTRKATDRRDKIYALLGMCSDNHGILADYASLWSDLLRQLIHFLLGREASVDTWDEGEFAIIRTRGYIIGSLRELRNSEGSKDLPIGKQIFRIELVKSLLVGSFTFDRYYGGNWIIEPTAKPVSEGDHVCIFRDASRPAIIRRHKDYFTLVAIYTMSTHDDTWYVPESKLVDIIHSQPSLLNFLLLWDWEGSLETDNYESLQYLVPDNIKLSNHWDKATRLHIMGITSLEYGDTRYAFPALWKAIKLYEEKSGIKLLSNDFDFGTNTEWFAPREYWEEHAQRLTSIVALDERVKARLLASATDIMSYENYGETVRWCALIESILARKGDELRITENEVIEAALDYDLKLINFLFGEEDKEDKEENDIRILNRMLEAKATTRRYAWKLFNLFLKKQGGKLVISEYMLRLAIWHPRAEESVTILLDQEVYMTSITERILIEAVKMGKSAPYLLTSLLANQDVGIETIVRVLKEAKKQGRYAEELVAILAQHVSASPITERVLMAAAPNEALVRHLVAQKFDKKLITSQVLGRAFYDKAALELLINYGEDKISISRKDFELSFRMNPSATHLLLDRYGHLPENADWAKLMTSLILEREGERERGREWEWEWKWEREWKRQREKGVGLGNGK